MHDFDRDNGDGDRGDGDSHVTELLRRFRPVDPPAELRMRILASVREPPVRRTWPWAAAAAALLLVTLASQVAADREAAKTAVTLIPPSDTFAGAAEDLTERLGGDDTARRLAEFMLVAEEARRDADTDANTRPSTEGGWQ